MAAYPPMQTPLAPPKFHLLVDVSVLVTKVSVTTQFSTTPTTIECIRHDSSKLLRTLADHYYLYVYGSTDPHSLDGPLSRIDPAHCNHMASVYSMDPLERLTWVPPSKVVILTQSGTLCHQRHPGSCLLLPPVGERELNTQEPLVLGPVTEYLLLVAKANPPSTPEYLSTHPLVLPT